MFQENERPSMRSRQRTLERVREYGISPFKQRAMLESQGHKCAICMDSLKDNRQTHLDHCHETGLVRGFLCSRCNTGLGAFRDSPHLLASAARFLNMSSGVPSRSEGHHRLWSKGRICEKSGRFFVRITFAPQRRKLFLLDWCNSKEEAQTRANWLQSIVNDLREANCHQQIGGVIRAGVCERANLTQIRANILSGTT